MTSFVLCFVMELHDSLHCTVWCGDKCLLTPHCGTPTLEDLAKTEHKEMEKDFPEHLKGTGLTKGENTVWVPYECYNKPNALTYRNLFFKLNL